MIMFQYVNIENVYLLAIYSHICVILFVAKR